jgi:glycosyltransferase involved in cell wall biosynthesis
MSTSDKADPHKSIPRAGEVDLLLAAADELDTLARALDEVGHPTAGYQLHGAASALDLTLPRPPDWSAEAFNCQYGRRRLFLLLLEMLSPTALIETGTYRGTTTAFMAQHFTGPIATCEVNPRWFLTAKANLSRFPQIDLQNQDSRDFLRAVLAASTAGPLLIYLDAHWSADLPLREELDLILSRGLPAAVIIDDFAVPSDPEYGFDDYGPGKALTVELLASVNPRGASLFFPTLPARDETGARRGCVVIGIGHVAEVLTGLAELKRHDWPTSDAVHVSEPAPGPQQDLAPLRRLVAARGLEAERDALLQRAQAAETSYAQALDDTQAARRERDASREERNALAQELDALRRRRRVAFIDHSYHQKTHSTIFLKEAMFPDLKVDEWWDDSWQGGAAVDIEWLIAQRYDLIVVVQVEVAAEALARHGYKSVVFIPMWDSCRNLPEAWWRALDGFRVISFCRVLHERVRQYGLPSIHLQYYPDPSRFPLVSDFTELRGFFWQRHHDLTWRHVLRLVDDTPSVRLHFHLAQDPGTQFAEAPSIAEQEQRKITFSQWFERKQDYQDLVASSNVYFAPRPSEGIGFSLLEAMAMGMCVVAPDAATMNEYLTDGVTGLLWNLAEPNPLDFSQAAELGRRARDKVVAGHQKWLSDLPTLREFVEAPGNRLAAFGDSLRFRGGSMAVVAERARIRSAHTCTVPAEDRPSSGGLRTRGIAKRDLAQVPLVTVVTVTLNCIDQFEGTIRSVLCQDYANLEVIVIDGGSTDGTLDLIGRYDDYLDLWSSGKDDGTYFAMNKAADIANGRYILFMNAGDWFLGDDAVSRAMRNAPSDVDFIIGHHIYRQLDGDELFRKANSFETTWQGLIAGALNDSWLGGVPCHQSTFTRTSMLREQRYDTKFRIAADHEFMYRQRSRGARFHNCDTVISVYAGGGLSAKSLLRTFDEWIAITSKYGSADAADRYFGPERRAILAGRGSQNLRSQIMAAEERAEHCRTEAEHFRAEAEHFRAEAERHRAEAERYKAEVEALRTSTSWRVTAALRGARRLFP